MNGLKPKPDFFNVKRTKLMNRKKKKKKVLIMTKNFKNLSRKLVYFRD